MGFLVVEWGSLKKGLAYGGGFQAAYMVGGMAGRNTRRRFGLKSFPNLQTMERRRLADRLHQLATSRRRFILVLAPQLRFAPQAA